MSTLDWSLQQATKTTAQIAAATTTIPLTGQIVWNTDTGKYCIGDGTTALSALTFYGGISASGLTIGTTTITGGTDTRVLYNNAGVVGEYAVNGTGNVVLSSELSSYLTTSAAALAYQPLDSDLTSWSSVTRASGFDTFVATPSSANLRSLLSDENGTGAALFDGATSPGFTTSVVITGGTGTLKLQNTAGSTTDMALYFNQASPSSSNYTFQVSGGFAIWNGGTNAVLRVANATKINCGASSTAFTQTVVASGAITNYTFTPSLNTQQTAGANIVNFQVDGVVKQWATGAVALEYFNRFTANTVSAVAASTFTHVSNVRFDAPLQGTNATATNLYAIDCGGHMFIGDSVGVPSNNPTSGGIIYVEAGALKYRGSSGTVTILGAA